LIVLFLGAGFSLPCGVPLAGQLFDEEPQVDRITRARLVQRTVAGWRVWRARTGGQPEEYLAHLAAAGDSAGFHGKVWLEAVWYVALRIALKMGKVESVGSKPTIVRHTLNRTTQSSIHEGFWDAVFARCPPPTDVSVVTTNYDVLIERGLRPVPRPRVHRPGFNYGNGREQLKGGGYPDYTHIRPIEAAGTVPVLKLHGSISWAIRNGCLTKYHDCRPAIRGDAAIVAPVPGKAVPHWLEPVWTQAQQRLAAAQHWIVIGYSFPDYDQQVNALAGLAAAHGPRIDVFDPAAQAVACRLRRLAPTAAIHLHPGLPEASAIIKSMELRALS
jgi:hypothetical protein